MDGKTTEMALGGPRRWFVAARLFAAPASLVPVAYGAALAHAARLEVNWWLLVPALLAGTFLHVGTNMVNDYFDFKRGVDREGALGGSGLLVAGAISPDEVALGAAVCYACGIGIGGLFIVLRGWPMFILGLVGVFGGFLYTGWPVAYKYRALGEVGVFLLMGPLMVAGAFLAVSGALTAGSFLAATPVGLLVAAILASNNLRDMENDSRAGIRTLAIVAGERGAKMVYAGLVLGAHAAVPLLCLVGLLPWAANAALFALVLAVPAVRRAVSGRPGDERLVGLDVATAQMHLAFGILLCLGTILG